MDEHLPQIIRQWLGNHREPDIQSIDTTTKEAASVCAAGHTASEAAKGAEPIHRKERSRYNAEVRSLEEQPLQDWAQSRGLWISQDNFMQRYATRYIGTGAEQKVYLHSKSRKVIKVNTGTYHGNWLEFFNRLLIY